MSNLNYLAISLATIAQFIVGAIWYMPLFGNLWGKIHGFDKASLKDKKEMQATMAPYLLVQLFFTLVTTVVLAKLIAVMPNVSAYEIAFKGWIGFIIPTQISGVIFGNTEKKWLATKFSIMAGASFLCMAVAAAILSMMK